MFFSDADREVYKALLAHYSQKFGLDILAYTLMTNHVHHLALPREKDSLKWTFQMTHKRYAEYINAKSNCTGHLWQARYYSSPVDDRFFWVALRYILRNPVEAGMTQHSVDYRWSSARALCGLDENDMPTGSSRYAERLRAKTDWMLWLSTPENKECVDRLRASTLRDLPTGSPEFLDMLEREHQVSAHPPQMGRPKVVKS